MLGFCHHHQSLQPRWQTIKNKYISSSRQNNDFGNHYSTLRPINRQLLWIKKALDYLNTMHQRVFENSEHWNALFVWSMVRRGWKGGRDGVGMQVSYDFCMVFRLLFKPLHLNHKGKRFSTEHLWLFYLKVFCKASYFSFPPLQHHLKLSRWFTYRY